MTGFLGFLLGIDSYFHVAIAEKMSQHGMVLREFPWATESVWADSFFDKEWLFHLILVPLLAFGKIGCGKVAVVLFNAMIAGSFWYLFRVIRVRGRFWWLLLMPLCTYGYFLERLGMCRPHVFSIAILGLCLALMFARRPILLALATAIYALGYTGHWQIVGLVGLYDILYYVLDDEGKRRRAFRWFLPMTIPVVAGMILGEVVHPNFPANIKGLWFQNVMVLKEYWHGGTGLVGMQPSELRRLPVLLFLRNFGLLLVGFVLVVGHGVRRRKPVPRALWFFGFVSLLYLVMTFRSQRFAEYLVPIGVTFIALYWSLAGPALTLAKLPRVQKAGIAVVIGLYILLGNGWMLGGRIVRRFIYQNNQPRYAETTAFLQEKLAPGDHVFTQSWSDPPILFFGAPEQHYLVFLDPFFMYARDKDRFVLWNEIKSGGNEAPLPAIRDTFGAKAVFIRGDFYQGRPVKFKIHAQLEQQLGPPDLVSKQGDVVYLIPPPTAKPQGVGTESKPE